MYVFFYKIWPVIQCQANPAAFSAVSLSSQPFDLNEYQLHLFPCAEHMSVVYAGITCEMFSELIRHYADTKVKMGVREQSYCELVQGQAS